MNKQEIQSKLDEATKRRMEISDNILWLKEQLTEAEKLEKLDKFLEKPKLRHGDFGITTRESVDKYDKFLVRKTPKGDLEPEYQDGLTDGSGYAEKHLEEYTIFGNVFDLMKGWDKPFESWESKPAYRNAIQIVIKVFEGGIFFGNLGDGATFGLENITEIWHELGHAIAELKRKKDREC